ncbi:MAG TPA: aminoglycoside adenylyltransferase domain-containing protein [Anaerolineales bacterium]|nr:aminoglycoside adenylyltransferase domain-containing protein [Anaerolineales bacterium]
MKSISSTPYPEVNKILDLLYTNVQELLKDQLVGMYLHGSLANGGFDEHSDIDIILVTKEDVSTEMFSALHEMHSEMTKMDSPWSIQLEVSYIPQNALRRFDRANMVYPHLDRGSGEVLHRMAHESDWIIQRHILREHGVVITGPHPQALIDPVSPNDLRIAVAEGLPLWLHPILNTPSEINKRGYQSFFILSLCRMLYTLKHGEILSKAAAAGWALENLDSKWKTLIERALIGRQNPNQNAQPEDINGTLDMMRYTLQQIKPTPYPEVNEVLNLLLNNGKEIMGDQFVGMYLYGSLSSGDFNPETSDIDFLMVTTNVLSEKTVSELEAMHKQTWATSLKRAGELEGAYVPRELIRRHDADGTACPTVNEGRFYVDRLGSDWIIQRHVVREYGVVVEGPDPKTLIDFVTPDEIRGSVMGVLQEWWFPMLNDPSWLREHKSAYCAFAVITMCRALHALEHGTVVSKPQAIQWARKKLGNPWAQLIDKAAAAPPQEEQDDLLPETLGFIRLIKERTTNLFQQTLNR